MDRSVDQNKLAQERNDPELEEDLRKVRGLHKEWADEKAGDDAEGANPEKAERDS